MKYEKYNLESDRKLHLFEFTSIGSRGRIKKLVEYTETNFENIYNLGFGDKNESTGEIDDIIITNNGDSKKVLATVAATIYAFTDKYPEALIYIEGNSIARMRLYRIGITNNLAEINRDFNIYGLRENIWHDFKNGVWYEAFLIERKK